MKGKKISFDDEKFIALIVQIRKNHSNATSTIKWRLGELLREHGLSMNDFGWRERRYVRLEGEQIEKEPVEARRIVSKGRNSISEEKVTQIGEMYLMGFSEREIAKALKVGKGTVGKYLRGD